MVRPAASDRHGIRLTGANPDRASQFGDENLAVANLTRASGPQDRVDHFTRMIVRSDDFDFDLRQKVDRVFGSAVGFGMTLLPADTAHFGDRHALNALGIQSRS